MSGEWQVPVLPSIEREAEEMLGTARPAPSPPAARIDPRPATSSILVAEDDPDNQALIELLLRRAGYRVTLASDGDEVFGLLDTCRPELFLLDCKMPRMNGPEVCARLKQNPEWADVPVIFLSMFTDPRDKVQGFEVGGADYVTKPIEELELLARIRAHLELARNRQILKKKVSIYEEITKEQMARLDEIRTGQESLLTSPWAFPELKAAVRFTPAHEAGGDFYEITCFGEGEFGFLVTDVAGHDLSVPFITGALKALSVTFLKDGLTPLDTMTMLNASLCSFLTDERYVTGCYAKYSRERMEVELINAGHPPALFQSTERKCEFVNLAGDALGLLECCRFQTRVLQVQPGDRLFLYSDGLIEGYHDAHGRRGRPVWGMKQMQRCVESLRLKTITETVDSIVDELLDETGGMVEDDILVLGVEFSHEPSGSALMGAHHVRDDTVRNKAPRANVRDAGEHRPGGRSDGRVSQESRRSGGHVRGANPVEGRDAQRGRSRERPGSGASGHNGCGTGSGGSWLDDRGYRAGFHLAGPIGEFRFDGRRRAGSTADADVRIADGVQ